jgi:hypothetical protein
VHQFCKFGGTGKSCYDIHTACAACEAIQPVCFTGGICAAVQEDTVELVNEYTEGIDDVSSPYDDTYTEYVIKDYFELTHSDDEIINGLVNGEEGEIDTFEIKYANINKIICSTDEQRIIFVAIGVYDVDSTDAEFLCTYFNRFDINPREYAHGREW